MIIFERIVILTTALVIAGLVSLVPLPASAGLDEGMAAFRRNDWNAAAREFRPLAEKNDPTAQGRLGFILFQGLLGSRDDVEALRLLNAAGNGGDTLAQHTLGNAYLFGRGVPKDPSQALVWYGRAADQEFPDSLHMLGEMYFNGFGVGKSEQRGIEYYNRAAAKNFALSLEKLAELSWSGRAMPTDRAKAVEYARKAAEANRPGAQLLLGIASLSGEGMPKDPVAAANWFRKAADQGNPRAQHNLGATYFSGAGVPKSLPESYFWLALSAARAPADLKANYEKERDSVGTKLSPQEVEAARARVADWKPVSPHAPAMLGPPTAATATPAPTPAAVAPSASPRGATVAAPESSIQRQTNSTGTGFLVSRDGTVLTNAHVVEQCRTITVLPSDGSPVVAAIIAKDTGDDLAVLKTSLRGSELAKFREDRPMRSGDNVVVVGYPLSSLLSREANVTAGVISAMAGIHGDTRHYQITAPVQKGNSGGPLADASGNVVGIVSSKLNAMKIAGQTGDLPQNVNFAIKSELARKFLDRYSIPYETAPAAAAMSTADVGERIKRVTVFIQCKVN